MTDLFNAGIFCEDCNRRAVKKEIYKGGFRLRIAECPGCGRKWHHPTDLDEYQNFSLLRDKNFQVKLRMVGNSFCVSIPREIIDFEEEMLKEMNDMIRVCLEEPEKLSLYFGKKLKKS